MVLGKRTLKKFRKFYLEKSEHLDHYNWAIGSLEILVPLFIILIKLGIHLSLLIQEKEKDEL